MMAAAPTATRAATPRFLSRKISDIRIVPGIETLLSNRLDLLAGRRIGLVTNHTGVDRQGRRDVDLLRAANVDVGGLFSPEHGIAGIAAAGEKVGHGTDLTTGLPVYSLYGSTREPTAEMLAGIDTLVFDMQDVGARFYTYPSTLMLILRAAAKAKIPVVVLDRPNPMGGELVEGPLLDPALTSFIGLFAMPVVHGMTMGELARMFVVEQQLPVDLTVIPMRGWHRGIGQLHPEHIPWIAPSPNIKWRWTPLVYPGTALFEGTNVSEGRGTKRPFEYIGAPFIRGDDLSKHLNAMGIAGAKFHPTSFTPTESKYAGKLCGGVQLLTPDRASFRPFRTGVAMVKAVHDLYPKKFKFLAATPSHFDRLAGVSWLREDIIAGKSIAEIEAKWQADETAFRETRKPYLLY